MIDLNIKITVKCYACASLYDYYDTGMIWKRNRIP